MFGGVLFELSVSVCVCLSVFCEMLFLVLRFGELFDRFFPSIIDVLLFIIRIEKSYM